MRERLDGAVVDAGHSFCRDHGVDDGFVDGLDRGFKERVHVIVGHHGDLSGLLREARTGICRGEGDEDITGAISRNAAEPAEAEGYATGEAFELRCEKRSIGGDDDDYGTAIFDGRMTVQRPDRRSGYFLANGYSSDAQQVTRAEIALNENADSVATELVGEFA